jgi:hypothetical protein
MGNLGKNDSILDETLGVLEGDTDAPIPMAGQQKPRTVTVLGILVITAFTFSFLGSYAVYNALVNAGVLQQYSGPDPRPKWLAMGFCALMIIFLLIGIGLRALSKRQFRVIDAMSEAQDKVREGWYET